MSQHNTDSSGRRLANRDEIRSAVEERVRAAEELAEAERRRGGEDVRKQDSHPTDEFVDLCIDNYESGDGICYAAIHEDFLFNRSSGGWLYFNGQHWQEDIRDKAAAAVEDVAMLYLERAEAIGRRIADGGEEDSNAALGKRLKKIARAVKRLRSVRGRQACLAFAATNASNSRDVLGEDLDQNPWLLGCANGVIDLKTGWLRDGRREDLITVAAPTDYPGIETRCPCWDRFLTDTFDGDDTLVAYLQRLLGYGLTGLTSERIMPVFHGDGFNGKGTIVETLQHVLGEVVTPIPAEMLLDQGRTRSSAGPSPDIMMLRGRRIVFASETDRGRKFSAARVKWLSGGDTMVGRFPHDRRITKFTPTHLLILLTNHKPKADAADFALWERMALIPFKLSFVAREPIAENERPADKNLLEKLKGEAPGILAWLVRGCLEWQQRGLDPPPVVKNATAEYRRNEDTLADFIEERCYLDRTAKVKATDLYNEYRKWYAATYDCSESDAPKQGVFGSTLTGRFEKRKHGKRRHYFYFGIGLLAPGMNPMNP